MARLRTAAAALVSVCSDLRRNREESFIPKPPLLRPRAPWWVLVQRPELPSLSGAQRLLARVPLQRHRFPHIPHNGEIVKNPLYPRDEPTRVIRGGNWTYSPSSLRSAWRGGSSPTPRNYYVGFGFRIFQTSEKA